MRVLVVGLGAIGGSVAVRMSAVAEVVVYTRRADIVDTVSRRGITLRELNGDISRVEPRITTTMEGDYDIVFIATRAYDIPATLSRVVVAVPDAPIVVLSNGIVADVVKDIAGDRGVCASVDYGVGVLGDGEYYLKIEGGIRLGDSVGGEVSSRVRDMIGDAMDVSVVEDIVSATYAKVIINSLITSTAIVTGCRLRDIVKRYKGALNSIVYEAVAVARASNIRLTRYRGLDFDYFAKRGLFPSIYRSIVWSYISSRYGDRQSTTAERMSSGIKSEVDYYTGYIVRGGEKYGVDTPTNRAILEMVKSIENGTLEPNISNLDGLI